MKKEIIVTGKTVEICLQKGAEELGVSRDKVTYEVIQEPKKGFLGIGEVKAEVKVIYEKTPDILAYEFVLKLLEDMEIEAEVKTEKGNGNDFTISIMGEGAGTLIGRHGDTLDALQYLVNLVANKKEDENDDRNYTKITVDIENYRNKRVETLVALAKRLSAKVLRYKKPVTLEPMSPYERRIIHSAVQNIPGVTTNSIGTDNNRRVVIMLDK